MQYQGQLLQVSHISGSIVISVWDFTEGQCLVHASFSLSLCQVMMTVSKSGSSVLLAGLPSLKSSSVFLCWSLMWEATADHNVCTKTQQQGSWGFN